MHSSCPEHERPGATPRRRRLLLKAALSGALVPLGLNVWAGKPEVWTYPLPNDGDRSRYAFEFALLRAALEATATPVKPVQLSWSALTMPQSRARLEVAAGQLSVVHSFATPEVDALLQRVPFPLALGLHSQRVLLTRHELLPQLAVLRHREELKAFRFGVLNSWSDRPMLQERGFQVAITESFVGLFKMLALGRSDVIMCSVLHAAQVSAMLEDFPELSWEPRLLLEIQSEPWFYTARSPEGQARAQRLLRGLKALQRNGQLAQLHKQYFSDAMSLSQHRRRIDLN